jgi:hypothetical protein
MVLGLFVTPGFEGKPGRELNVCLDQVSHIWWLMVQKRMSHLYYIIEVMYKIAKYLHHMKTTILRNHSWLGDDGLDLYELIVTYFMLLILAVLVLHLGVWVQQGWAHIRSSLNKLWGIMCMSSLTVAAHVKCKAYQREELRLSVAFNR